MTVNPAEATKEFGLRTSAVTVWEFERSDFSIKEPVRPVAPIRRTCIFLVGARGICSIVDIGCAGQKGGQVAF